MLRRPTAVLLAHAVLLAAGSAAAEKHSAFEKYERANAAAPEYADRSTAQLESEEKGVSMVGPALVMVGGGQTMLLGGLLVLGDAMGKVMSLGSCSGVEGEQSCASSGPDPVTVAGGIMLGVGALSITGGILWARERGAVRRGLHTEIERRRAVEAGAARDTLDLSVVPLQGGMGWTFSGVF